MKLIQLSLPSFLISNASISNMWGEAIFADHGFSGESDKELIAELVERLHELEAQVAVLQKEVEIIEYQIFEKEGLYVAKSGDTLQQLAERYDTTVDKILEMNPQINPRILNPKLIIRVREVEENKSPAGSGGETPASFTTTP